LAARRSTEWLGAGLLLLAVTVAPAQAQQDLLSTFEEKVTTFTLDNGLEFVVVEQHDAPVASFATYADVGAVDEPQGKTGLAHMFEHMAFKGTTSIGTKNIEKEMEVLRRQEELYLKLRRERAKGPQADSARIAELEKTFKEAQKEAESYVKDGEFENLLEREGATGINAYTSADATVYFYSLPANKAELFFALEADRFANPVLREFYTERDVVMEERRQRYESAPFGRLRETFRTVAFKAHPYGEPGIGHMSDIKNLSRTDAKQFFEKYYNAGNLTIGIAGDVDPERMRELAEKYFRRLPEGEEPMPVTTKEPDHRGERRVVIREQTQPLFMIGYLRPSMFSPDDPVYDVLADVLTEGRTSRLHRKLVETEKALFVNAFNGYPGEKYQNQFVILGGPNQGVSIDSVEQTLYDELERIKQEGITEEELERAKTRARSKLIGGLGSNDGLARRFARTEALMGDWRHIFRRLDEIQSVTAADVQRVAKETFTRENRTVALITNASDAGGEATAEAN
jgi:predicted Zn-dependent peptidase